MIRNRDIVVDGDSILMEYYDPPSSDKFYFVKLVEYGGIVSVVRIWGRTGAKNPGFQETKYSTVNTARLHAHKLIDSKLIKGYEIKSVSGDLSNYYLVQVSR